MLGGSLDSAMRVINDIITLTRSNLSQIMRIVKGAPQYAWIQFVSILSCPLRVQYMLTVRGLHCSHFSDLSKMLTRTIGAFFRVEVEVAKYHYCTTGRGRDIQGKL